MVRLSLFLIVQGLGSTILAPLGTGSTWTCRGEQPQNLNWIEKMTGLVPSRILGMLGGVFWD